MTPDDAIALVEKLKASLNQRTKLLQEILEKDRELKRLDQAIFEMLEKAETPQAQ